MLSQAEIHQAGTSGMMKASCNYQKNVKEEIEEKLDRSANLERRRCPGSMWYSQKTGDLNLGEAIFSQFPPKKDF